MFSLHYIHGTKEQKVTGFLKNSVKNKAPAKKALFSLFLINFYNFADIDLVIVLAGIVVFD